MQRVDDRAADPVAVMADILKDGPVRVKDLERLAFERGVGVAQRKKSLRALKAECHRHGGLGSKGYSAWCLPDGNVNRFIKAHRHRRGFYCDNLFDDGKEVQCFLGHDLAAARLKVKQLLKERDERRKLTPRRMPRPPENRTGQPAHLQLREVARQLLNLYRLVKGLESIPKEETP